MSDSIREWITWAFLLALLFMPALLQGLSTWNG
jgi:hypothetical protein